ncbi:uncharacterized protein KD926_004043 [Aspergillus affinis]|uniref:uncharacterized protein n=1 Tax=Aspergillus affinis TaxID=1070780 RepID=UPI0022FE8D6C|nr:uncharacterized protein KD926_004043 [Aspergillus affinis]KAI9046205.1 hypothetical protein KD926_004043 [Aspergillus affinis]
MFVLVCSRSKEGIKNGSRLLRISCLGARVMSFEELRPVTANKFYSTLVVSANDPAALKGNIEALCTHLINPRLRVKLDDLAYTLSERRSNFFHRAYVVTQDTEFEPSDFVMGKKAPMTPRIGFVFTGQGAQWPIWGQALLQYFPETRALFEEFDQVLQSLPSPPTWSFVKELSEPRTAEHLRQPEFSHPLVTALQLAILSILETWNVTPSSVVGHSSGEIAAAHAAGFLDRADVIKAAFYRDRAAVNKKEEAESDPSSLTISGRKPALEALASEVKTEGHFARLLLIDLAYHSKLMGVISDEYESRLAVDSKFTSAETPSPNVAMFSSVTGSKKTSAADAHYWRDNMVSPVRFTKALSAMVSGSGKPDILIEIGSGALAGPVSQVLKSIFTASNVTYMHHGLEGPRLRSRSSRLEELCSILGFGKIAQQHQRLAERKHEHLHHRRVEPLHHGAEVGRKCPICGLDVRDHGRDVPQDAVRRCLDVSASHLIYVLLASLVLYYAFIAIHRLYLSELARARIPGPRLAAITFLYEAYYEAWLGGQMFLHVQELHKKYGPIVRITPDEVHFDDPETIDAIFPQGGRKTNKPTWLHTRTGTPDSIFSTVHHDQHRQRRNAVSSFFSPASVHRLESILKENLGTLIARLDHHG